MSHGATSWDRHVAALTSRVVSGGAILPIGPDSVRKASIYGQKGVSLRAPEAVALVEAIMDGKLHKDYLVVGGQQYILTTVVESAYYGRCTSTATGGGIVIVKARRVLVIATYAAPTVAAEAIPYVHQFADELTKDDL